MYKRKRIGALDNGQQNDLVNVEQKAERERANELALQNFLNLVIVAVPQNSMHEALIEQTIASLLNIQESDLQGSVSEAESLWNSESISGLGNTTPGWQTRLNVDDDGAGNTPPTSPSSLTNKDEEVNNYSPTLTCSSTSK